MHNKLVGFTNQRLAWQYLENLRDDRELSAALAIHFAWMRHSSPFARAEFLQPIGPVDLLVLYRAMVATFNDFPSEPPPIPMEGNVFNRDIAEIKLRQVQNEQIVRLALCFLGYLSSLSERASEPQDLEYALDIFLRAVQSESVVEGIVTGALSQAEQKPINLLAMQLDFW